MPFIPIFTTYENLRFSWRRIKDSPASLRSKPETIIKKYKERSYIEQTNKELKSLLDIEGSYFCKKESNYGYFFMVSLVYNIVQYLRLFFDDMSHQKSEGFLGCQKSKIFKHFKDVLEELSAYLLWKNPPKCVFEMESKLNRVFENIGSEGLDKMNIGSMESTEVLGKVLS
ncbi:MAG: hypothetical protein MOIL_01823 [Candidatus Methanolliviera sp. GoM_oil]|nr:MAG: hypothetical protein MOIL_01823 [Candidatus Methanolliviera sp. GoM_oil]